MLAAFFIAGLIHVQRDFVDYPVFERAGQLVAGGDIEALYDLDNFPPYYYGYLFALFFVPIQFLGVAGKYLFFLLFFLSYLKVLYFSVRSAERLIGEKSASHRYGVLFLTILLSINVVDHAFGTANVGLLLLAMGLCAYDLRIKHPWWAGLIVAMAVIFKFYPLVFFFFFVWEKRWKVVGSAVLSFGLLYVGLPVLLYGWERGIQLPWNQMVIVRHFGDFWSYSVIEFQNISSTVLRYSSLLLPRANTTLVFYLSVGIASLITISLFLKSFFKKKAPESLFAEKMFLFILAMTPLVIPVSWVNMGVFYIPMITYLVYRAILEKDLVSRVALAFYFMVSCLTTSDLIGRPLNDRLEFYAIPFLGIVALVVAYLRDIFIQHKAEIL